MAKTIKMRNGFTEKAKSLVSGHVSKAKKGKKQKTMKCNSKRKIRMALHDEIPVKRIKSSEVSCENFAKFFHKKEKLWKQQKKRQKLKIESDNVNGNPKPSGGDTSSRGKTNKGQKLINRSDKVNWKPNPFDKNTSSPNKTETGLKLKNVSDNVDEHKKPSLGYTSSRNKTKKGLKLKNVSDNVDEDKTASVGCTSPRNKKEKRHASKNESDHLNGVKKIKSSEVSCENFAKFFHKKEKLWKQQKKRQKFKIESDNVDGNPKPSDGDTSLRGKTNKGQKLIKESDNVNGNPSTLDRNISSPNKAKNRLKLKYVSGNVDEDKKPSLGYISSPNKTKKGQKLKNVSDNVDENKKLSVGCTSPTNKTKERLKLKSVSDNVDEDKKPSVESTSSRNKKKKKHKLKNESDHFNGDKKLSDGNTSSPNKVNKKQKLNNVCNYMNEHPKPSDGGISSAHKTKEDDPEKSMSKSPAMAQHRIGKETITTSEGAKRLHDTMSARLTSSRFRYLNERLYSITSNEAAQMFSKDSAAYDVYHEGYNMQVKRWPMNPQDVFIKQLRKLPTTTVIADLGCGNAAIAKALSQHKVLSYDLVATDPVVTQCDMASLPVKSSSVDVAIFCLALMGVNLDDFIFEANRILKIGGDLKIAEVVSRFENVKIFSRAIEKFGFELESQSIQSRMFIFFHFKKERNPKRGRLPSLRLKPCVYKKR